MNIALRLATLPVRLLLLILVIFSLASVHAVQAGAVITVSEYISDNTIPGDTKCTLREAIGNANINNDTTGGDCVPGNGFDTIIFETPDIHLLTLGELVITDDLTLTGLGKDLTIIEVGPAGDRVFNISSAGPDGVTISDLTIRGANISGNGGGILNQNTVLVILNSLIQDNIASHGGGIVNEFGEVTLEHSILLNNGAGNMGGGIFNTGFGTLNIINSTISSNSAGHSGGGIFNEDGSLFLTASTVNNNQADYGGGILNGALLEAHNSTISGNQAAINGGGLFNVSFLPDSIITYSTISQNSASGSGGGIYNESDLRLGRTIVADNTLGFDCDGSQLPVSDGYNLDSDGTCNLVLPTDLPAGLAHLGPLQDNGGPTETHALLDGSEAIDWVTGPTCAPPLVDQRGFARPFDGNSDGAADCDIGAYEFTLFFSYLPIIKHDGG